jgi:hypothetical protein
LSRIINRILMILVVAALMVVLMAASVSPAFAKREPVANYHGVNNGQGGGFGSGYGCEDHKNPNNSDTAANPRSCGWSGDF